MLFEKMVFNQKSKVKRILIQKVSQSYDKFIRSCFFRALSISSFKVRYFGRRQAVLFIKNQLKQVDKTFLIVDFL